MQIVPHQGQRNVKYTGQHELRKLSFFSCEGTSFVSLWLITVNVTLSGSYRNGVKYMTFIGGNRYLLVLLLCLGLCYMAIAGGGRLPEKPPGRFFPLKVEDHQNAPSFMLGGIPFAMFFSGSPSSFRTHARKCSKSSCRTISSMHLLEKISKASGICSSIISVCLRLDVAGK